MTDTFAHRLIAYMAQERRRLQVEEMSNEQKIKAINDYYRIDYLAAMNAAKLSSPKKRVLRIPSFNALCAIEGKQVDQMTRDEVSFVNKALTKLRDACPGLTPEEIGRRAARYKQKHPTWELTIASLLKYWSSLSDGKGLQSELDEPEGWRGRINEMFTQEERDNSPATIEALTRDPWSRTPRHLKESIIRRYNQLTQQPKRDGVAQAYFGE